MVRLFINNVPVENVDSFSINRDEVNINMLMKDDNGNTIISSSTGVEELANIRFNISNSDIYFELDEDCLMESDYNEEGDA